MGKPALAIFILPFKSTVATLNIQRNLDVSFLL